MRVMPNGRLTAHRSLLAIDLFAGCGGLTTGLRKAGFKVVAAVEIEVSLQAYEQQTKDGKHYATSARFSVARKLINIQ